MASEGLPERLERVVGPEGLEGVRPFDARNPLHVDVMAGKLLSLTLGANDVGSFSLLIDVCEEKLVEIVGSSGAHSFCLRSQGVNTNEPLQ